MALTMVHLLAADRWALAHAQFAESPEFFLGAISPDAIHIRDHDDKSHKNAIHLNNWQSPHPQEVIDYWRNRRSPFDVGYGVHVLTDGQWVPRYRERLKGILKPDGRLDTEIYYHDTFVTDFRLLQSHARLAHILGLIERASVPADHPLLSAYELEQWRRDTVAFYRGECPRQGPARFIDEAYVAAFVADSTALIEETYLSSL